MTNSIYLVDVFAERPYYGNQLAVVVGAETLPDETMQLIAAEMNFSETTFVTSQSDKNGGYAVRIFTPAREIAFTGHPIIGTAWVLREHVIKESPEEVLLNLEVGEVPVTFEHTVDGKEIAWFRAPSMSFGAMSSIDPVATALGISPQDINSATPIQVISAGTSAMIVPLNSLDALRRSKLNLDAFAPLQAEGFPPLVYLFTRETREAKNDLSVRFFFEAHGVREDPATGNGAAFLGAYLLQHRLFSESNLSLRIEQGYEIHRPSLILLRATTNNDVNKVSVGGYVIPTVEGRLV